LANRQGINFEKWIAAGNSFIIVDGSSLENQDRPVFSEKITNSKNYIDADGVLFVDIINDELIRCDIYNRDGSNGEFSLNGFRIAVAYCYLHKERLSWAWTSLALDKWISSQLSEKWQIDNISQKKNCFSVNLKKDIIDDFECTQVNIDGINGWSVSGIGNPHFVVSLDFEANLRESDYSKIFEKASMNENFPFGVNVHFIKRINKLGEYSIETYERGVGRTLSCGSGSLASSICINKKLEKDIEIIKTQSNGGTLEVSFGDASLTCKGPVKKMFDGFLELF
tara:strand:- start:2433 stop:3278 length:846 start_codon:yes stop_codon:yes gene_type:complete